MRALAFSAALAIAASPRLARADTSALSPAGSGQPALAVAITSTGVGARVCAADAGCSAAGGSSIAVPDDVVPFLAGARARVVDLAGGRHLVRVDVGGGKPGEAWVALVAAASTAREPVVVWSGWTGRSEGEYGEGKLSVVVEEDLGHGEARLAVGEQREDVTLCGRPAVVSARSLDPASMTLRRGASVQSLTVAERASATRLFARKLAEPMPAALPLLRATVASSAVDRRFATLTDGDPSSVWSEAKAGDGGGELVDMASAPEVGITALEIAVRPPEGDVAGGAAPRTLFLATEARVFAVTMPEDGWLHPGARYAVDLPEPLHASCLAVVLDSSYARDPAPRVTLAEITAHTAFDGTSAAGLAGALAGGGDRAREAAALLARSGEAGVAAAEAAYPSLDDAGRSLALDVVESAPCAAQVPFFAGLLEAAAAKPAAAAPAGDRVRPPLAGGERLDGSAEAREVERARDRLRRCGRASVGELARLIATGAPPLQAMAADDLAGIAPEDAVPAVLDAMASAGDAPRAVLRAALARAAKRDRARAALAEQLARERIEARPRVARIDLLRASGAALPELEGAAAAFADLARPDADFRTRFLLLGPAGELARAGDEAALGWLRAALRTDGDAHVRARAAEAAGRVPGLSGELVAAVDDAEPRVREAAIRALAGAPAAGPPGASLEAALVGRLKADPWTFVRAGAAEALAALPASQRADGAAREALVDAAPDVRVKAADVLGAHAAIAHAEALRDVAGNDGERLDVRVHAIYALAAMCDAASLDAWTKLAAAAAAPMSEADRRLGAASIAALGAVHPGDLAQRLAPLLGKDVAAGAGEAARAALAARGKCAAPR